MVYINLLFFSAAGPLLLWLGLYLQYRVTIAEGMQPKSRHWLAPLAYFVVYYGYVLLFGIPVDGPWAQYANGFMGLIILINLGAGVVQWLVFFLGGRKQGRREPETIQA